MEVVSQVGFPIAACIGLFYLYYKDHKGFAETLTEMKVMIESLSRVIENIEIKISSNDIEKTSSNDSVNMV